MKLDSIVFFSLAFRKCNLYQIRVYKCNEFMCVNSSKFKSDAYCWYDVFEATNCSVKFPKIQFQSLSFSLGLSKRVHRTKPHLFSSSQIICNVYKLSACLRNTSMLYLLIHTETNSHWYVQCATVSSSVKMDRPQTVKNYKHTVCTAVFECCAFIASICKQMWKTIKQKTTVALA